MPALPPDGSPPKFDAFKARVSDVTFSIHEYMPNRLRFSVQVPKDALLVLNEIYFPGWRATVWNGVPTPARRAAGGLRALPIQGPARTRSS